MSSYQPLISVIMPCYNAEQFLPMALDSIINQTYTNLEILCINDGSTDKTADILEEYAKKDKRIRVVHNEANLKLIVTLNKGIALAKGDYIARMDADDVSHLERIKKLYETLVKEGVDVVSCNSENIDIFGVKKSTGYLKALTSLEIEFASYLFTPIGHPSLLGKKEVFIKFPYSHSKNTLHTEDYELWTRMIRNGVKLHNHKEALYFYRINSDSVSRKFESIQIDNFIKTAQIHLEFFLNQNLDLKTVAVAVNRIKEPNIKKISAGFLLINELYKKFTTKNDLSKKEIKTISNIVAMQKADISIQSIKKGGFYVKTYIFWILFGLIMRNVFNSEFKRYLRLKF